MHGRLTPTLLLAHIIPGWVQALRRGSATIDLVVERHCEDLDWLYDLSDEIRSRAKVFVYDKPGNDCNPVHKPFPDDLQVSHKVLPNVGRDGHDQLEHIIEHYDDLGTHVVFVQAGFHWTLKSGYGGKAYGWFSQAEALNELLPTLTESVRFLPLVQYSEHGPVQWQDRQELGEPEDFEGTNVKLFIALRTDLYNRAKELYAMFFGGTPCEAPPQKFTAGMQYVVHRDSLVRRPLKFWKAFQDLVVSCDPEMGYTFERLTTALYNSSILAVDPARWPEVSFCKKWGAVRWSDLGPMPLKKVNAVKFWRKEWGCEPVQDSQRMLHIQANSEM